MEKLSGILPSSPRIKAIDTTKSQPARPGAPAFGRMEGKNSLGAAKAAFSEEARLAALQNSSQSGETLPERATLPDAKLYRPSVEETRSRIVEDITERFFGGQPDRAAQPGSVTMDPIETPDLPMS